MEIKLCASTHFTKGYVVLHSLSPGKAGISVRMLQRGFPWVVLCARVPGKSSEDWHSGSSLTATTAKLSCSHISDTTRTFEIINLGCFKGKLGVTGYSGMNIRY